MQMRLLSEPFTIGIGYAGGIDFIYTDRRVNVRRRLNNDTGLVMMLPNGREEADEYFYNIDFADDKHVIFHLKLTSPPSV